MEQAILPYHLERNGVLNAGEVVELDLDYICTKLTSEFRQMAGSTLLLTGGAGFLGYYLVQSVLHWNRTSTVEDRIRITVFDSYARGLPGWLEALGDDSSLMLVRHDVTDPMPRTADDFDYIIHAASIASPIYYRLHPIETMDANVDGLRRLLEYARDRKEHGEPIKGFLFFSTSEIYGDPPSDQIPTSETYRGNVSCTGPRACYDESKRYGETLCVNFARTHELPIRVARPFNNYGPGLKITDRRVLPDLFRNVLKSEDITLHSDGSPTRTFCYIADAIVGYYKILTRGRVGEAYNVGVETPEISMLNLAEAVATLARETIGYEGRVVHKPSPDPKYLADNPYRRCPDIAKARAELQYEPSIGLKEGLRRTLSWYLQNQEAQEN